MKTVGRIILIVLASMLIVGATWAVGQSSSESTFTRGERPEFASREERPAAPGGEFRERGGDQHAAQVFSLRGWLGFAKTLVPMTLIITLVALPMHFWKKRHQTRRRETSTLPA